jgi:hypothetical protein
MFRDIGRQTEDRRLVIKTSRQQPQSEWMVQSEPNHGLRRYMHFFASRDNLRQRPGSSAGTGPDGRALSASGNRSDDCSQDRSSTDEFAGAAIAADSLPLVIEFLVRRAYPVAPPFYGNGFHVEYQVTIIFQPSDHQSGIRASRNRSRAVAVSNIVCDLRREGLSLHGVPRINALICSHRHFRTRGEHHPFHMRLVVALVIPVAVECLA